MKVTCQGIWDYEWCQTVLYSERDLSDAEIAALKEFLGIWPEEQKRAVKDFYFPDAGCIRFEGTDDRKTVRLVLDHFPEELIQPLARALAQKFPCFWHLVVGKECEPAFRDDEAFIAIPKKTVVFEDGNQVEVPRFRVAKYPVSVEQFESFVQATGFMTIAEQEHHDWTFRDNPCMAGVVESERGKLPALFVSFVDATAYCKWAQVRLPTEAEWVAASLIEDRVHDGHLSLIDELRKRPEALIRDFPEITGTTEIHPKFGKECVVIRSGPFLVRTREMLRFPAPRHLTSPRNFEDYEEFRVCKP